jgi:hypothetical protein
MIFSTTVLGELPVEFLLVGDAVATIRPRATVGAIEMHYTLYCLEVFPVQPNVDG